MGSRGSLVRLLVVSIAIVITFSALAPTSFLTVGNFEFLAQATPEVALLSLGISLAMLAGGIDLSVVAIANLAGIASGLVMVTPIGATGGGLALAILLGVAVAVVCGVINGTLIAGLRVPPILATLGTSQLYGGIGLVLSGGTAVSALPTAFTDFANITFAGVPLIFLLTLLLAGLVAFVVTATPVGVRIRLLGANAVAAEYSGISARRVTISTYALTGGLAGVAGLIISSRASSADTNYGSSYILLGIVVAVLAGVNPDGGHITITGVIVAAIALQTLSTGLTAVGVSSDVVSIAQGAFLIAMLAVNVYGGQVVPLFRRRRFRRAVEPAPA
ncbi:ABC transporter permease [Galbitalea soli]|uniref:ABC transporter permease n=1 Tax=Galbitalea soli TaxID=1268042 RepID=A0A7C9TPG8_9MICO|nr:ABC transporter permease [Galbitalea soli]NEM90737.1 ABC transporter permease [Galbitalea soli]NYJ31455.1 simple sugar transport system permease protein [Galbitalea soli]